MAERLHVVSRHLNRQDVDIRSDLVSTTALTHSYMYTVDSASVLTPKQRQFYEDNGYLVIKGLVPEGELENYRKRFGEICRREVKVRGVEIVRDIAIAKEEFVPGEKAVTKIQHFNDDDVLFGYCCLPEVVKYVEDFVGPDIVSMTTMLINKPPDAGKQTSRHPMHQDLHYFPFRPAERIVCSWTAMQRVNRENGCLVVVPGTHKGSLLPHEYPKWQGGVNKLYHGIEKYDPSQPRVHLAMEAGDTVFFHPLLIHGSGTNRTQDFRKSISCHYASGRCHYVDQFDPKYLMVTEEIKELISKRSGIAPEKMNFKLEDYWKIRSRTVKGEDCLNQ